MTAPAEPFLVEYPGPIGPREFRIEKDALPDMAEGTFLLAIVLLAEGIPSERQNGKNEKERQKSSMRLRHRPIRRLPS
jgi:hypothetical protein